MAIARAILRNPAILILDEATSALDPRTEAAINETLIRIGRGRTTVSVTHRLSSVVNADRIFVLDRGKLVEQGTHDELLERGGLYANLWKEQGGAVAGGGKQVGVEAARLQNIPMFAQLPPNVLNALANRLAVERFAAGEDIIRQGDVGDKLYVVQRGQVEVLASDRSGATRPLAVLREGDYFGEMALLHDAPRAASVRARSPVQVYTLSKVDFTGLVHTTPQLRQMVEKVMAQREAMNAAQGVAVR
jgi:ATP-binding cassette subfamily B protein